MPLSTPIHPGKVDWTGENPGILLKDDPDGPFTAMALFFRIAWSPVGRGQVLLLYSAPDTGQGLPDTANLVMHDNRALADFLMQTFIAKLGAFAGAAAFPAVSYVELDEVRTEGDSRSRYAEHLRAGELSVDLVWDGLGKPTALELPVELTGPKDREMYTLLVESREASITVNGRRLPGTPAPRVQAGIETTTAFLYFSETWIWPAR